MDKTEKLALGKKKVGSLFGIIIINFIYLLLFISLVQLRKYQAKASSSAGGTPESSLTRFPTHTPTGIHVSRFPHPLGNLIQYICTHVLLASPTDSAHHQTSEAQFGEYRGNEWNSNE